MTGPAIESRRTSESFALAAVLAAAAGSIEAYSVIALGAFAGAQTGNVVLGSIELSQTHWSAASHYIWPILAFVGGALLSQVLRTDRLAVVIRRPFRLVLGVELVVLVVVGFLPGSAPRILASVLVTFAVAAQAATFRKLVDIGYNSAFTTGNLMTALAAAYAAIVLKDQKERAHARWFGTVISCYAVGALAGAVSAHHVHRHGAWLSAALLAVALALFVTDRRLGRQTVPE